MKLSRSQSANRISSSRIGLQEVTSVGDFAHPTFLGHDEDVMKRKNARRGGRGSRHQEITMEKVYSEARARDRIEPRSRSKDGSKETIFRGTKENTFFSLPGT